MSEIISPEQVDALELPRFKRQRHAAVVDILAAAGVEVCGLAAGTQQFIGESYEGGVDPSLQYEKRNGTIGTFVGVLNVSLSPYDQPQLDRDDLRFASKVLHDSSEAPEAVVYGRHGKGSRVMMRADLPLIRPKSDFGDRTATDILTLRNQAEKGTEL